MLRSVFGKTLWDARRSLLGWVLGVAGLSAMYGSFYRYYTDPRMAESIKNFPAGLMKAFGVEDLTTPEGYLQSTVYAVVVPLLIVIFSVAAGARAIAGDQETGALELLLAHPVSRPRVVLERFAAITASVTLLGVANWVVLLAISKPASLNIPVDRLAAMAVHLILLGLVFGALALAAGAVVGRRAVVLAVAGTIGVLSYFANTLAPQIKAIAWARWLSPFHYFSAGQPLRHGIVVEHAGVLLAIVAVLVVLAVIGFRRRDVTG